MVDARRVSLKRMALALLLTSTGAQASSPQVPAALAMYLPDGFTVLALAESQPDPAHDFTFVALGGRNEASARQAGAAPPRPLLIFRKLAIGFRLVGRSDNVILRSDEGGQCDPFGEGSIATRGPYVTIENGVACGAHWTDYVTFRFDRRSGNYLFDNRRVQSWRFNPSEKPGAVALIQDVDRVERANGRIVPFARWRRVN